MGLSRSWKLKERDGRKAEDEKRRKIFVSPYNNKADYSRIPSMIIHYDEETIMYPFYP